MAQALRPGDRFAYTFDLGDQWEHTGQVLKEQFDPLEIFGEQVPGPVVLDGWGTLPDQYGRESEHPDDRDS